MLILYMAQKTILLTLSYFVMVFLLDIPMDIFCD